MLLVVGKNTYNASTEVVNNCIKLAKETNYNKNAIVAIRVKSEMVEMRNDIFPTVKELNEQIKYYEQKGIKVYYTKKGGII